MKMFCQWLNKFWNFISTTEGLLILYTILLFYILIFLLYMFIYQAFLYKFWKNRKEKEKIKLHYYNKESEFVDYTFSINKLTLLILCLLNKECLEKSIKNSILLIGEYGIGKTYLISNIIKNLKDVNEGTFSILNKEWKELEQKIKKQTENHKTKIKSYYIDVSKIENNSKDEFGKSLFNEITKCTNYRKYWWNLFKMRFFKLFSEKIPFDLIKEYPYINQNKKNKIIIFLDEIDRLEKENIITFFSILKSYFVDLNNLVFIISINEEVIRPLIQSHYCMKENDDKYEGFMEKIANKNFEHSLSNNISINFEHFELLKDNKLIQKDAQKINQILNSKIKKKNPRHIQEKINSSFLKFNFFPKQEILKNKPNKIKSEILELIMFIMLLMIYKNESERIEKLESENFKNMNLNTEILWEKEYFPFQNNMTSKFYIKKNNIFINDSYILSDLYIKKIKQTNYKQTFVFKNDLKTNMSFFQFYFFIIKKITFNFYYVTENSFEEWKRKRRNEWHPDDKETNFNVFLKQIIVDLYKSPLTTNDRQCAIFYQKENGEYELIFNFKSEFETENSIYNLFLNLEKMQYEYVLLKKYNYKIHDNIINILTYDEIDKYIINIISEIEKDN